MAARGASAEYRLAMNRRWTSAALGAAGGALLVLALRWLLAARRPSIV